MPQMDGVQAARKIAESGADIPILPFTLNLSPSDHGNGSQRWAAWCDLKGGNQQVGICDQGASARRDLLLFDLNGGRK